jgi:hypothetical protein|tara:strand:- start:34 stop:522 length:489 start_codon:yes stop_codon:yes gene_type:complete
MIKLISDNNVLDCINLMDVSTKDKTFFGYEGNQAVWISFFLNLVKKQKEKDPHVLVIGDYKENKLRGFLSACTFVNYYNNTYTMDVKDCIVDHNYNNAFVIYRLFDYMIEHTKKHGGKNWRADSVRSGKEGMDYAAFLNKRYNTDTHVSVRGVIQENKDETI